MAVAEIVTKKFTRGIKKRCLSRTMLYTEERKAFFLGFGNNYSWRQLWTY